MVIDKYQFLTTLPQTSHTHKKYYWKEIDQLLLHYNFFSWQGHVKNLLFRFLSVLRGHNWVYFAHRPQRTVILNSNFVILKTIRVKQLLEPIVLRKKGDGFCFF